MDTGGCAAFTNDDIGQYSHSYHEGHEASSQYNQDYSPHSGGYIGADGGDAIEHSMENGGYGNYDYATAGMHGSQSIHADYGSTSEFGEYGTQGGYNSARVIDDYADGNFSDNTSGHIQNDPNPIVVKKKYPGPCTKYLQRICVRYLKPPNPPPPGPLIVKEVRDPQPPPPPPLCIKQKMPQPKTPPPLILRERPPQMPPVEPSKVVCKRIPAPPPPKRQVIIERLPKLPPKPRDILIERWLPYPNQAKRKVIYQKAPPPKLNKQQKNLIIMYEGCTQVERMFKKLGVTPADPQQYLQQYGHELFDKHELENRAKNAGVHEDLTPPITGSYHHAIQDNAYSEVMGSGHGEHSTYGNSMGYQQAGESYYQDDTYGAINSATGHQGGQYNYNESAGVGATYDAGVDNMGMNTGFESSSHGGISTAYETSSHAQSTNYMTTSHAC